MKPEVFAAMPGPVEAIGRTQDGKPVYLDDSMRVFLERLFDRSGGADDAVREGALEQVDNQAELSSLQEQIEAQNAVIAGLRDEIESLGQALAVDIEDAVRTALNSIDLDSGQVEEIADQVQRALDEAQGSSEVTQALERVDQVAEVAEEGLSLAQQAIAGLTPESIAEESTGLLVPATRRVNAGTGLGGGGALSGDVTLSLSNTAVAAGSYGSATAVGSFTANAQGQLTNATNTPISFPVASVAGQTGAVTLASSDLTNSSNIPLLSAAQTFSAKQTFSGNIQVGTHTAIGAETVSGFITIEDAGGTSRKLAVVS